MDEESRKPDQIFATPFIRVNTNGHWSSNPNTYAEVTEYVKLSAVQADPAKFGVEPVQFINNGDAEARWVESERCACLACGGSGHIDDMKPRKAKALEWDNNTRHGKRVFSSGDYAIIRTYRSGKGERFDTQYRGLPRPNLESDHETLEAAKAAAQAHYQAIYERMGE